MDNQNLIPEASAPPHEYVLVNAQDTQTTIQTLRRDCFGFILLFMCIIVCMSILYMYVRWGNGK